MIPLIGIDGGTYIYKSKTLSWEPTAQTTDPLLVDRAAFNWHLQSGSPAIGVGIPNCKPYN